MVAINVNKYNNFNFTNKGRIHFKVQVVYEVGLKSRFRKLIKKKKLDITTEKVDEELVEDSLIKHDKKKKESKNTQPSKKTKVITWSQKQNEKLAQDDTE